MGLQVWEGLCELSLLHGLLHFVCSLQVVIRVVAAAVTGRVGVVLFALVVGGRGIRLEEQLLDGAHKPRQAGPPRVPHEDPGAGLEGKRPLAPEEVHAMVLLAVHEQTHLGPLHGDGEASPAARQVPHLEGRGLLGGAGARVGVEENHPLRAVLHLRQRDTQVDHLLISVGDGEQHSPAPGGGLGGDGDGEVVVEGVGDEGLGEAAHVGARSEAVGRVALEPRHERHGGRQRDADQLGQVQLVRGGQVFPLHVGPSRVEQQ